LSAVVVVILKNLLLGLYVLRELVLGLYVLRELVLEFLHLDDQRELVLECLLWKKEKYGQEWEWEFFLVSVDGFSASGFGFGFGFGAFLLIDP